MRTRLHPTSFINALAFGTILAVVGYAGCDNGATTTTAGATATVTNGTGYHPGCNGGVRDGFCNALGVDPETCDCLDCVDTAYCKGGCKNDGVCNPTGGGEDCTCIDCVGKSIPDGMGGKVDCYGGMGQGPATTAAAGGGSGSTSSSKASTSATQSATTAVTTGATTAATTAATTSAATTATTSTGAGG